MAGLLRGLPGKNTVIYKIKLVKGLNRNFGLYTPLDFLAAVTASPCPALAGLRDCSTYPWFQIMGKWVPQGHPLTAHIPDAWEHLTRYYGFYSSVQRGKRIKAGLEERSVEQVTVADESPGAKTARRNWAKFIKKIYEVDPLLCPDCGGR